MAQAEGAATRHAQAIDRVANAFRQLSLATWLGRFKGLTVADACREINRALPELHLAEGEWRDRVASLGLEPSLTALFGPVEAIRPLMNYLGIESQELEIDLAALDDAARRRWEGWEALGAAAICAER